MLLVESKSIQIHNPKEPRRLTNCRATGAAKLKNPEGGFNHSDLSSLFTRVAKKLTREPTRTPVPQPGSEKKSNLGAIIGGAVGGGIALIAAIVFIIFTCRRRNRNKKEVDTAVQQEQLRKDQANSPAGLQIVTPTSEMSQPPLYNNPNNFPQGNYGMPVYHPNNSYHGTSPPGSPSNQNATPTTPGGYSSMSSAHNYNQFPGPFPPPSSMMQHQQHQQYPYPRPPQTPMDQGGYYNAMHMPQQYPAEAPGQGTAPVEMPLNTSPPPKIYPFIPPPERDDGNPRQ